MKNAARSISRRVKKMEERLIGQVVKPIYIDLINTFEEGGAADVSRLVFDATSKRMIEQIPTEVQQLPFDMVCKPVVSPVNEFSIFDC